MDSIQQFGTLHFNLLSSWNLLSILTSVISCCSSAKSHSCPTPSTVLQPTSRCLCLLLRFSHPQSEIHWLRAQLWELSLALFQDGQDTQATTTTPLIILCQSSFARKVSTWTFYPKHTIQPSWGTFLLFVRIEQVQISIREIMPGSPPVVFPKNTIIQNSL